MDIARHSDNEVIDDAITYALKDLAAGIDPAKVLLMVAAAGQLVGLRDAEAMVDRVLKKYMTGVPLNAN
jgi:hypothetical protein